MGFRAMGVAPIQACHTPLHSLQRITVAISSGNAVLRVIEDPQGEVLTLDRNIGYINVLITPGCVFQVLQGEDPLLVEDDPQLGTEQDHGDIVHVTTIDTAANLSLAIAELHAFRLKEGDGVTVELSSNHFATFSHLVIVCLSKYFGMKTYPPQQSLYTIAYNTYFYNA